MATVLGNLVDNAIDAATARPAGEPIPRLRSAGHDCDVMVICAARGEDPVRGAVRHGAVGYLLKAFEFTDLRIRLERYAAQRGRLLTTVVRGQANVDRVLAGVSAPGPVARLPKGLSVETADLIERALREAGGTLSARNARRRPGSPGSVPATT